MKAKPVIPREQVNRDVEEALAYYLSEAGEALTLGFRIDVWRVWHGQPDIPAWMQEPDGM